MFVVAHLVFFLIIFLHFPPSLRGKAAVKTAVSIDREACLEVKGAHVYGYLRVMAFGSIHHHKGQEDIVSY